MTVDRTPNLGITRIGLVHYNTVAEIDRLVEALHEIAGTAGRGA